MIAAPLDTFATLDSRIDRPVRWDECGSEEEWWCCEVERRRRRLERFATIEDHEQQEIAYELERMLCAADVKHFIEQYVWIQDPHRRAPIEMREMPFVLWPCQIKQLTAMDECMLQEKGSPLADLATIKPRELGISWTCQAWFFHRFKFHPFSGFCVSAKEDKVDDKTPSSLFGKFRFMEQRVPLFLRSRITTDKHMHLERDGGLSVLKGDSTSGDSFRGLRGDALLGDEFAAIHPSKQEELMNSTESVTKARFFVSTAQGPGNRFAKLISDHPNILEFSWRDDPRRTDEWAAAKRDSMGQKQFDQEYGGKVVTLDAGAIWHIRKVLVRYGENDSAERAFQESWKNTQPIISGWDFGSGPSLLVCINAIVEHLDSGKFRLWIDSELVWSRTEWVTAAADAVKLMRGYGSKDWTAYGDPSGSNPESNLESWETNLRAGGVPMFCLPTEVHKDSTAVEWSIRKVQGMIDNDRLRVHDRCRYVWSCLENWARHAPTGADLDYISRAYIAPKHDIYSHGGKALLYLIEGAMRQVALRAQTTLAARQAERDILAGAKMPAQDAIKAARGLRR